MESPTIEHEKETKSLDFILMCNPKNGSNGAHSEKQQTTTGSDPVVPPFPPVLSALVVDHPGSVGASPSEQIGWSFTVPVIDHLSRVLLSFLAEGKGSVMKKR